MRWVGLTLECFSGMFSNFFSHLAQNQNAKKALLSCFRDFLVVKRKGGRKQAERVSKAPGGWCKRPSPSSLMKCPEKPASGYMHRESLLG